LSYCGDGASSGDGVAPPALPDGLPVTLRLLLSSEGTFVELLEACVGEPVIVRKLAQTGRRLTEELPALTASAGTLVVERRVLLCRASAPDVLVDAQSLIIPDRLPPAVVEELDRTSTPLGQILVDQGVLTLRRHLATWTATAGEDQTGYSFAAGEPIVCRAYTIEVEDGPAILINEWLPHRGPWDLPVSSDQSPGG
jgi:chorismate lyase